MPNLDGRGPRWGGGSMSGWRMGPCVEPGFGRGFGRGRGFGWGRGFGRGRFMPAQEEPLTKEEIKKILKAELKDLEAEKREIEKQLKELK